MSIVVQTENREISGVTKKICQRGIFTRDYHILLLEKISLKQVTEKIESVMFIRKKKCFAL